MDFNRNIMEDSAAQTLDLDLRRATRYLVMLGLERLERYPMVADSVLNYGLQPLAGRTASGIDAADLEQRLRQSILAFEPRLLPNTVIVRAIVREDESDHNALSFEIEGSLWAQPLPLSLFLKTEIDLENGNITIAESAVGKDA